MRREIYRQAKRDGQGADVKLAAIILAVWAVATIALANHAVSIVHDAWRGVPNVLVPVAPREAVAEAGRSTGSRLCEPCSATGDRHEPLMWSTR